MPKVGAKIERRSSKRLERESAGPYGSSSGLTKYMEGTSLRWDEPSSAAGSLSNRKKEKKEKKEKREKKTEKKAADTQSSVLVTIEKEAGARVGATLSAGGRLLQRTVIIDSLRESSLLAGRVAPGDILLSINGKEVHDTVQAAKLMAAATTLVLCVQPAAKDDREGPLPSGPDERVSHTNAAMGADL